MAVSTRETPAASLDQTLAALGPSMRQLLSHSIEFPSVSGGEGMFTRYIAKWADRIGFHTDLWVADESELVGQPGSQNKHIPLAERPTLVIEHRGNARGSSLLFNAHADVVAAQTPGLWRAGPWSGKEIDGRVYGRGACDVKGPLVAALWAMCAMRELYPDGLAGDVLLELVPGEEDCVGLGTLTSVVRGHRADAAVILEPTENIPRCASRAGCRFEITCIGKSVHGTVKWLGRDAIKTLRRVLDILDRLERRWNDRAAAGDLFADYPFARPVTVDAVKGGEWQGMICDECTCAGYLELLPGDSIEEWGERFRKELLHELEIFGILSTDVRIEFTERYFGHRTDPTEPICVAAEAVACECAQNPAAARDGGAAAEIVGQRPAPSAFNSGCEAGVRALMQGTPTLVWGPGSLEQAHAIDEFIRFDDVAVAARMFARLMLRWCNE